MSRDERLLEFKQSLESRILLLDGALGTMIQGYGLGEDDFRGDRFGRWHRSLHECLVEGGHYSFWVDNLQWEK